MIIVLGEGESIMKIGKDMIYDINIENPKVINPKINFKLYNDLKFKLANIIREKDLEKESVDLKNTEMQYKYILKEFKKLAEKLNLKGPLSVSMLFTYLARKGYFSRNMDFKFDEERILIDNALPYSIIEGRGVCLNLSAMLVDCLQACGYNGAIIANYTDEMYNNYHLNVRMQKQKHKSDELESSENVLSSKFCEIIEKTLGNHAFVMIENNNNYYIYDPTSSTVKLLKTKTSAKEIIGEGNSRINTFLSYYLNSNKKSLRLLRKYENKTQINSTLNPMIVLLLGEDIINRCKQNDNLFENFYYKISPAICEIADFVDSFEKKPCKTK